MGAILPFQLILSQWIWGFYLFTVNTGFFFFPSMFLVTRRPEQVNPKNGGGEFNSLKG